MTKFQKYSLVALRVGLGLLFLYAGLTKLDGFAAAGYLQNGTSGVFAELFERLSYFSWVNFLVVFGEIGIGVSLVFGVVTRFGLICMSLLSFLLYLTNFPPEHGLINEFVIYILAAVVLYSLGAGRYLGIDAWLEKQKFVKRNYKYLRWVMG